MSVPAAPDRLRVAIATPQFPEDVELLRALEPRLDVVFEPDLLPAPGVDAAGLGAGRLDRTPAQQKAYERMLDSADALFGVPDQSGRALARAVRANPGLRWVHTIPAGGGQQVRAAKLTDDELSRVLFTTSAGVHAEPLAEFAVLGVLAGAKDLTWMRDEQAARRWGDPRVVRMVSGSTAVVIGLGSIGRAVAVGLAALGVRVVGVHRRPVEADGVTRVEPMERMGDAVAEADAVIVALPGTDHTRGIVDASVFGRFRPGTTFVNVGRGSTVDETALLDAMRDGRVATAVLDVTATEPLPAGSPLWDEPGLILSPHTVARTDREPRLIVELFADNARRLLDGEPLRNVVDTVEFY